jgi:hypothetical protein
MEDLTMKTKLLAAVALLAMSSTAFACEGVSTQATDCILYYGPVAQSPYRNTVPAPAQPFNWQGAGASRMAPQGQ